MNKNPSITIGTLHLTNGVDTGLTLDCSGNYGIANNGILYANINSGDKQHAMAFGLDTDIPSLIVRGGDTEYQVTISLSDYRIKENIKQPKTDILDRLSSINIFDYTLKRLPELLNENQDKISNQLGFFAHELQEMFPEYDNLVIGAKDDVDENGNMKIQQINLLQFGNILMKSIQEQNEKINQLILITQTLQAEIQELKSANNTVP
jgi:hypothetical protein